MNFWTNVANSLAKYSCDRWNKSRILRKVCRVAYQGMGDLYVWRRELFDGKRHSVRLHQSPSNCERRGLVEPVNTLPWPYVEENFANWPEDDTTGQYTLVTDPAGFVVHHSTSYCAWKLRELMGRWPLRRRLGVTYHAKFWRDFLSLNGYNQAIETPLYNLRGHNIGIIPDEGEFGQLLWYEHELTSSCGEKRIDDTYTITYARINGFVCTTYQDHRFCVRRISLEKAKQMIWVKIQ